MSNDDLISTLSQESESSLSPARTVSQRWRRAWNGSLRFRLIALGLMPLLLAFPLVMGALTVLGGQRGTDMLQANLRSQLGTSQNYLEQLRTETAHHLSQLVRTERMAGLLGPQISAAERQRLLTEFAGNDNLDYLLIVRPDGEILASHSTFPPGASLQDGHVLRQARLGVSTAALEKFAPDTLALLGQNLPMTAQVNIIKEPTESPGKGIEADGLVIHAAVQFPLKANMPEVLLVGGTLLNRNASLIEHMRALTFPPDTLPDNAEGITLLATNGTIVNMSQQRLEGGRALGMPLPAQAASSLQEGEKAWYGALQLGDAEFMTGFERLRNGEGQAIGTVGVAFPYAPYTRAFHLILWSIGGVLALTMLVVSFATLAAGRELTRRLSRIEETMIQVLRGDRSARVNDTERPDQLGTIARNFNTLLDTITRQNEAQQKAQRTIAAEASRRRALFEHERDGVAIVNPDGGVFEANPGVAMMLGYSLPEMHRLNMTDWDTNYSRAEIEEIVGSLEREGLIFESVLTRKDGTTFPAEVSLSRAEWGKKTFVIALLRDISERKAVEQKLMRYQEGLEKLVDQRTKDLKDRTEELNTIFAISPDGFVSFDRSDRVASVNAAFTRMTGLHAEPLKGLGEADFSARLAALCTRAEDFPGVAALRQALAPSSDGDGSPNAKHRWQLEMAGTGNRVLEVSLQVSESDSVSQVLYVRDVTHETEVDRMKSEFLSTAAHELRTPMASIYGFSELLLARKFSDEKRQDLLETISRQAGRMSTIIDELLDLARIEARRGKDFVLEPVALEELVDLVVTDYKTPPGRNAPLIQRCTQTVTLQADRSKLQQVLLNVLSNAYKYSPDGGEVRIACSIHPESKQVTVSVSDQGMGMTPEQLKHVFDRFYRADTSGHIPGTGLGMSIVKEIVELHRGHAEVTSAHGVGTTVTLFLPTHADPAGDTPSQESRPDQLELA